MFQETTLQDWLTLSGPDTSDTVTQDYDLWTDTEGYDASKLHTILTQGTNVSLAIETAVSPEGPWTSLYTITTASDTYDEVECDTNAQYRLDRYLRWTLTSSGASWKACFMIAGVFEKSGN